MSHSTLFRKPHVAVRPAVSPVVALASFARRLVGLLAVKPFDCWMELEDGPMPRRLA